MFFEKLLDMLKEGWELLCPFVVIAAYQNAGVLRFGLYHRTLKPGFHWKWPLAEEINQQEVTMTTMRLPPQTLTTKDGKSVVAAIAVKYWLADVQPYITNCTDQKDVLIDVGMGALHDAVMAVTWDELASEPHTVVRAILEQIRKEVNEYGFRIKGIKFTDRGTMKSLRLVLPHGGALSN